MVLEAMKTSVAQVCAKYAKHDLSDEQVQSWRQHVIDRGGEIFEPKQDSAPKPYIVPSRRNRSPVFTFVATFSILANLGAAALAAVYYFELIDLSPWLEGTTVKSTPRPPPNRPELNTLISRSRPSPPADAPDPKRAGGLSSPGGLPSRTPVTAPMFGGPQPSRSPGIVSEVEVCGARARGNKIVFVLDLNDYMRIDPGGESKFERLRKEVRDAILGLDENTTFNILLLHGISRLYLFEDKLVSASTSKRREAYAWLSVPVWDVPKGVESRFGEHDLMLKPPAGVVGPWRAVSAALSFNPDVVYLLTGDCSSLQPNNFSASELSGVEVSTEVRTPAWERWRRETSAIRLTIEKWLQSDSLRAPDLEVSADEVDSAARQLGIAMPKKPAGSPDSRWPWKDMYVNFKRSLMRPIPDLATTHVIVSLPKGREWPIELEGISREFTTLSGGSFTIIGDGFFSSP